MRVIIFDADEDKEIKIVVPTDLIMNPLTAAIAAKAVKGNLGVKSDSVKYAADKLADSTKNGDEDEINEAAMEVAVESISEAAVALNIDAGTIREMFRALKKFKKNHPDLPLVEVYSSDGDRVIIML